MKRRDFLKSTAVITGGGMMAGYDALGQSAGSDAVPGPQPNILFILVDELRFPTVFPAGIKTPGEFLKKHMPNVHCLWERGVKFGSYYTAANACTPSRGTLLTGLYSQQSWLLTTILSTPYPPDQSPTRQPVLNSNFPTWGKLLQSVGYQTPYFGKWHVSVPSSAPDTLAPYGYDFQTYYDPTGDNLQGTYGDERRGYHNDAYSASQAVRWLGDRKSSDAPWCTTVSLINPHDREFFPAGTEFKTVSDLFDSPANPEHLNQMAPGYGVPSGNGPVVPWEVNKLKSPPQYGYPELPPNWESLETLKANKPTTHEFIHEFSAGIWGGATDDPLQDQPTVVQYPNKISSYNEGLGIAHMPFSYWQRGLDSYTQCMEIVDGQIGRVLGALNALPDNIVDNTVIIFAADHGEYSGAHGMMQGKMATVYEEAWHVPLIVVDPSNRFTSEVHKIRTGLVSSVDLLGMFASLGNLGTDAWMQGDLRSIYGNRLDLISMLKSANAPGRPYILQATDEIVPDLFIFNNCPTHVLGIRTPETKLGTYSKWLPLTSNIIPLSVQKEYYDYSTSGGQLELDNTWHATTEQQQQYATLINSIIPEELQETLPGELGLIQKGAKLAHLLYREVILRENILTWLQNHGLQNLLGYGAEF